MNRDLSGEGVDVDDLPPMDTDQLRSQLARLRQELDTVTTPGWAQFEVEWTGKREGHYRTLGSAALTDIAALSVIRGEVAMLDSLLTKRAEIRADIEEIEAVLREAEPEMQEA